MFGLQTETKVATLNGRHRAQLGVAKFTPIGYSYLGLMVVLYSLEHPDRVERIVQLDPVPMRYGTEYPPELRSDDSVAAMSKERLALITDPNSSRLRFAAEDGRLFRCLGRVMKGVVSRYRYLRGLRQTFQLVDASTMHRAGTREPAESRAGDVGS